MPDPCEVLYNIHNEVMTEVNQISLAITALNEIITKANDSLSVLQTIQSNAVQLQSDIYSQAQQLGCSWAGGA